MNKPATKDPSMEEILSSIRQIIADDDAAPKAFDPDAGFAPAPPTMPAEAADTSASAPDEPGTAEPLELTADQILPSEMAEVAEALDFNAFMAEDESDPGEPDPTVPSSDDLVFQQSADFMDPDDVAFEKDEELTPPLSAQLGAPTPAEPAASSERIVPAERLAPAERFTPPERFAPPERIPSPAFAPRSPVAAPPTRSFAETPRSRSTTAQVAPMPDASLSADMAEELLEPATHAAVRANFARLNNLGLGTPGLTIEAMMREMLRPMLKEWLDEHLPTMVERMVEKEIARVSRGVE